MRKNAPNIACSRLGVRTAFFGHFSGLEFFPFWRRVHAPTPSGSRQPLGAKTNVNQYVSNMTINSFSLKFTPKQIWYFATMCSFTIGWSIGWIYLNFQPYSILLSYIFWVYPIGIAGLTMSLSQWALFRRTYRFSYLWIPIITLGSIASTGAALALGVPVYLGEFKDLLIPFTPIALLIGPVCQWLMIRKVAGRYSFKEISQICILWIAATSLPIVMVYMLTLAEPLIEISRFTLIEPIDPFTIIIGMLSGLFFAVATQHVLRPIETTMSMSQSD